MRKRKAILLTAEEQREADEFDEFSRLSAEIAQASRKTNTKDKKSLWESLQPQTEIARAIQSGKVWYVKRALNNGGDPNEFYNKTERILHAAASSGHLEIVQLLVQQGADFRARDHLQRTAGERAAKLGHQAVAEFLGRRETRMRFIAKALFPFTFLFAGINFPLPVGGLMLGLVNPGAALIWGLIGYPLLILFLWKDHQAFESRSRFVAAISMMTGGVSVVIGCLGIVMSFLPNVVDALGPGLKLVLVNGIFVAIGWIQYRCTPGDASEDPKF